MSFVHNLIGSSISDSFALIHVTYPEGSTCTCTKGTKVLTASDTSGEFVFSIPESGTWTVKCTNNSSEAKKEVVISTKYQLELVNLSYKYYLYNRGTSTGYTWEADGDARGFSDKGTYLQLTGVVNISAGARHQPSVDATQFTKLTVIYSVEGQTNNVCMQGCRFGSVTWNSDYSPLHTELAKSVDISNITGNQITFLLMGATPQCIANIYEVYLE